MAEIAIGYTTDDLVENYTKQTRQAKSLEELLQVVKFYKPVADDAIQKVLGMNNTDFKQFQQDVKKAKTITDKKEAEDFNKKWGDLVMPRKMLIAAAGAEMYGVPFGTAYIRLKEMGKLK